MNTEYFLAANSGRGFFSLYDEFPPEGAFLHIIKGGPGTGKSSFMRRLRQAAEERGLDTETVLCSGDPDSLDGLYIPALGQAWVDGTAPHIGEPKVFGVDSDYVNLGAFCRLPLSCRDRKDARELNTQYKAKYASAYSYLNAAKAVEEAYGKQADADDGRVFELLNTLICGESGEGSIKRCFVSAISCRGIIYLHDTVNLLCKHIYRIEPNEMDALLRMVTDKKVNIIQCLSPLSPDKTQTVILPDCAVGFTASEFGDKALTKTKSERSKKQYRREERTIKGKLLSCAVKELAQAKELHDKLEKIYRPYIDFDALTSYTDNTLSELFTGVQQQ